MPSLYLDNILKTDVLRQPILKRAIRELDLPPGSRGLDAGCGAGLQCLLFAEEIGREGHVTGLDVSSEFLAYARDMVGQAGLDGRITFTEGDVASIPCEDNSFDWIWSADCVGYGPGAPVPLLKELKRVIKPGGLLSIAAWSSEELLPGYPLLEARLRATASGMAPFSREMEPSRHFLSALGWLRETGLVRPKAEVFAGSCHAPLNDEIYRALEALFEMRWQGVEQELSEDALGEYKRLCRPDSPDFVLRHPDYYCFFTYSMFWGHVPE
jgi:demethylmenaquinone methyltransferase/2-methoxy-6-polyprenyl-1,4-benzoquinol methylase